MDAFREIRIPPDLVKAVGSIDEFKGRWSALGRLAPERLSALRRVATIESVGSSTRIEGARLTNGEVERLLSGLQVASFRSRDEQEVAGYADAMDLVFSSSGDITLTENHIRQVHGVLLKHSEKDERHRGQYKTLPNHVEAFDERGKSLGVLFETASPFETPRRMESLVAWTRDALEQGAHHPLLVIGVFVVHFLAIHPFQDGNGRLSRVLTTLLLLREGYEYVPFASLERIVEENKDDYYVALRRAQAALDTDPEQVVVWLRFFLQCLVRQIVVLGHKLDTERLMSPLAPLAEAILKLVRGHGRVTVREAVRTTGANRNTVKDHLRRLVASGMLVAHGRGRGTWYEAHR